MGVLGARTLKMCRIILLRHDLTYFFGGFRQGWVNPRLGSQLQGAGRLGA